MTHNIAIFLDLDNLLIGAEEAGIPFDIKLLISTLENLVDGRAVLRCAYGDYRQRSQISRQLTQAGFQLQSVVRLNNSDKNLADMQMVAEAVETLINGYRFQSYVIITGDRDFIPLVQVLRRHDKQVIGVGVKHTTSGSLVELCDEYIFYDDLFPEKVKEKVHSTELQPWLKSAADVAFQNSDRIQASVFREFVEQASKGLFKHSPHAKGSFRRLLEQFPTIVELEQEETTLYVVPVNHTTAPKKTILNNPDLYLHYRSVLKKSGLRVILPATRILILRDLLYLLEQKHVSHTWHDVMNLLRSHYQSVDNDISKNSINDILRLARRAKVIEVSVTDGQSLNSSIVSMLLSGEKVLQQAVMQCDFAYLSVLKRAPKLTFDLEQASIALYDSADHIPYLTRLLEHF